MAPPIDYPRRKPTQRAIAYSLPIPYLAITLSVMKIADFRAPYEYSKGRVKLKDYGNCGPQPTADADPKSKQALSLQGTTNGMPTYDYAGQGAMGYVKK